jgi:hypothetical protein
MPALCYDYPAEGGYELPVSPLISMSLLPNQLSLVPRGFLTFNLAFSIHDDSPLIVN